MEKMWELKKNWVTKDLFKYAAQIGNGKKPLINNTTIFDLGTAFNKRKKKKLWYHFKFKAKIKTPILGFFTRFPIFEFLFVLYFS